MKIINSIPVKQSHNYFILIYVLNVDKDDNNVGALVPIASFNNKNEASKFAAEIAEKSGMKGIVVSSRLNPIMLERNRNPDNYIYVYEDKNTKELKEILHNNQKHDDLLAEKENSLIKQMNEEIELEKDNKTFDHYKINWHYYFKLNDEVERLENQINEIKLEREKVAQNINNLYKNNPEHDENFIEKISKKLFNRNQDNYLRAFIANYKLLRNKVLNSN